MGGSARLASWFGMAVLFTGACRTYSPPGEELRELLERPAPSLGAVRRTAWSRIRSPWFSGEFRAVLVEQRGSATRVRLQLLPDLGGKVLDMVVTPTETAGSWPHTASSFREAHGADLPVPPRGPIGFLAVSLLENATPLRFDRVRAMRREAGGYRLEIEPAIAGENTRIEVRIADDGALLSRHYTHLGVGWHEVFVPEHRFASKDFEWVLSGETEEEIAPPPDQLFEWEPPREMRP